MLEDKLPASGSGISDPVTVGSKLAGIEPVRRRRGDGAVHESRTLGRLQYVRMPAIRPSFWHGVLRMPDCADGLKIVCEVEDDDPPGADHAACVVAIRRRQLRDAHASLPVIRQCLRDQRLSDELSADDLRLVGIHLSPKPMITSRQVLEYRAAPLPRLLFIVVFQRGRPTAAHIDGPA
jgi:hypothetical protein